MEEIKVFRGYLVKNGVSTDSGWGTGIFASEENSKQQMSIKGSITTMDKKTLYEITGKFEFHPRYGKSFSVEKYRKAPINSPIQQIKFLSGPSFPGVGEKTASLIVNYFGDETIKKLVEDIEIIQQVPELNEAYIPIIKKGILDNIAKDGEERIRYMFFENNLKTSILDWMENYFDKDNRIIENIFKSNFLGFARDKEITYFEELDKVAVFFGLELDSPERIGYWAWKLATDILFTTGDTFTDKNTLSKRVMSKLKINDTNLILQGILYAKEKNLLVLKDQKIYTYESWLEEQTIAEQVIKLNQKIKSVKSERIYTEIEMIEKEIAYENNLDSFSFDEKQKAALAMFAKNKLCLITGGPGTGKTTLIKGIVKLFNRLSGTEDYAIATPTGRAAARIRETYKKSYATTVHKLLQAKELNKFDINKNNPLKKKLVILDECSMIDNRLFYQFLQSCDFVEHVVLVGDANQLPSVGYGNTFSDLLELDYLSSTKLETVHRQKNDNGIIDLAYKVLNKDLVLEDLNQLNNVNFHLDLTIEDSMKQITKMVGEEWNQLQEKSNHIQIICPMYGGNLGIDEINAEIQNKYNNNLVDSAKVYNRGDYRFVVDDKIMFLKNDPDLDLANGDVGKIIEMNYSSKNKLKDITTEFNDKSIILQPSNFSDVKLSYATSVHKTQGSEYDNVILVLDNGKFNFGFINKTLIYTAITRAKSNLTIIGNIDLLFSSIKIEAPRRLTTLIEMANKIKLEKENE